MAKPNQPRKQIHIRAWRRRQFKIWVQYWNPKISMDEAIELLEKYRRAFPEITHFLNSYHHSL